MTQAVEHDARAGAGGKGRVRRLAYRVGRVVVMAYVVAVLLGWILQEKIIFPGAWMSQGKAEAVVVPGRGEELVNLATASGEHTVARFGGALTGRGEREAHAERCPTLLYFYGNGECLAQQDWQMGEFRKLGVNVICPEYVGYGMAGGKPSEAGCYEAAEAAYRYVVTRGDVDPTNLLAGGWSLGAAVACDLAAKHQVGADGTGGGGGGGIRGVFMFSAFTSARDVGAAHYGFLPVSLMLRHHFRSEEKIGGLRIPILLGHGMRDSIVPYEMSLRLKAAAKGAGTVRHVAIEGADHNDFYAVGEGEILPAIREFIARSRKE